MQSDKPPLGIMPEYIWKHKRMCELSRVLYEYISNGYTEHPTILIEWSCELHKLLNDTK